MSVRGQVSVIDASALVAIEVNAPRPSVFGGLQELVEKDELTYCDQVVDELEHISRKGQAHVFAKGSKSLRFNRGADYMTVQNLVLQHRLVDHTATFEQCAPYVLAQAIELSRDGHDVVIISADSRKKRPPLISLCEAARRERIALLDPRNFLSINRIS